MPVHSVVKHLSGIVLRPAVQLYLRKERTYHYKGVHVKIQPGVFHPGLFFSTKILIQYLSNIELKEKHCLELGAGSGLISCYMAKQGAVVTASDLNSKAVECITINAKINGVAVKVIQSDLFDSIPTQQFDYVIINPPFYLQNPLSENDLAWYAGKNGEYFVKLFSQLKDIIYPSTHVLIILSDECDFTFIQAEAKKNKLILSALLTKKKIWDTFIIYNAQKL